MYLVILKQSYPLRQFDEWVARFIQIVAFIRWGDNIFNRVNMYEWRRFSNTYVIISEYLPRANTYYAFVCTQHCLQNTCRGGSHALRAVIPITLFGILPVLFCVSYHMYQKPLLRAARTKKYQKKRSFRTWSRLWRKTGLVCVFPVLEVVFASSWTVPSSVQPTVDLHLSRGQKGVRKARPQMSLFFCSGAVSSATKRRRKKFVMAAVAVSALGYFLWRLLFYRAAEALVFVL